MFFDVIAKFMTYFLTILTSVSLLFIQWISSIGVLDHIVKDEGVVLFGGTVAIWLVYRYNLTCFLVRTDLFSGANWLVPWCELTCFLVLIDLFPGAKWLVYWFYLTYLLLLFPFISWICNLWFWSVNIKIPFWKAFDCLSGRGIIIFGK